MIASNVHFIENSVVGGNGELAIEDISRAGSGFGGAICNMGGSMNLENVVFSENRANGGTASSSYFGGYAGQAFGGAIYSSGGDVIANHITLTKNAANGGGTTFSEPDEGYQIGGSAFGGGFYLASGMAAIFNGAFVSNSTSAGLGSPVPSYGGCVFNAGAVQFVACSFGDNFVNGAPGQENALYAAPSLGIGGAIYNGNQLELQGCSLSNNAAMGGTPGGEFDLQYLPADGVGGALYNAGSAQIQETTLAHNSAVGPSVFVLDSPEPYFYANGWGGAIYNTGFLQLSSAMLISNFISGATNFGEEIYNIGVIESDTNSFLAPVLAGTPPLTFQWDFDSNAISSATSLTFNLGNIQFGEAGTYSLLISNAGGLVTNFPEIINLPPPPLSISSVTPNTGLTLGGTNVTIIGTGFTNGASVYFGGTLAASVTVVNATNITAETPAVSIAGPVNVTIINGDFQTIVITNGFTYIAPVSISPQSEGINTNGTFIINVGGPGLAGYNFTIESSTDLGNWEPLQTNSGPFTFIDTNASSFTLRFYRAVLTP